MIEHDLNSLSGVKPSVKGVKCISCSLLSLVPRPPPFFVLQFAFSIIHVLNANQRTKNGGGLGTRLLFAVVEFASKPAILFRGMYVAY